MRIACGLLVLWLALTLTGCDDGGSSRSDTPMDAATLKAKYGQVKKWMPEDQVAKLLGEPNKTTDGNEGTTVKEWRIPGRGEKEVIRIIFSDGKVVSRSSPADF